MVVYINATSSNKQAAEKSVIRYSEEICNHISKCLLYRDSEYFDHWIKEIANWLGKISKINIKPDGRKFDSTFYDDEIFGFFGETLDDLEISIESFQLSHKKEYDFVNVDSNMLRDFHRKIEQLKSEVIPKLVDKSEFSKEEFQIILKSIL